MSILLKYSHDLPKEDIDQKEKTGIPPPSPLSFVSSQLLENCIMELLVPPLAKHLSDVLALTMLTTVVTCRL